MTRRPFLLAALFVALSAPAAPAQEAAQAVYERGLKLYEEGDYDGAVDEFSAILATGIDDPSVHYNLGNAWFKSGRLGLAIWHYRLAHRLAPRDEDIAANLEYARFLALDQVEGDAQTDLPVERWLDRVTADEAWRLSAIFWILAGVAGVVWQLAFRAGAAGRRSFVVLVALWALSFAGAWSLDRRAHRMNEAVVLPREAVVRIGPGESFETAFELHEGAEVVVEGERGPGPRSPCRESSGAGSTPSPSRGCSAAAPLDPESGEEKMMRVRSVFPAVLAAGLLLVAADRSAGQGKPIEEAEADAAAETASTEAASETEPATTSAAASTKSAMTDATEMMVSAIAICEDIQERAPVGESETFSSEIGQLCCFTTVHHAGEPTQVFHRWYVGDEMVNEIPINVQGERWRCWSRKTIYSGWKGECKVEIANEEGDVLATASFMLE